MLLIIEPDSVNRDALVNVFRWVDSRYRIDAVTNNAEGFALIGRQDYDMVVFDRGLSKDLPSDLRRKLPDSLLIESMEVYADVEDVVDFVISKPPSRLEAIECSQRRKGKVAESKKAMKAEPESEPRPYRLEFGPAKPMTFIVGLLEDSEARFGIPIAAETSIADALYSLGKNAVRYRLIRNGKQTDTTTSDILQEHDLLLLEN